MEKLKNVYLGEVLLDEFLIPFEFSACGLLKKLHIPQTRTPEILNLNKTITAETALPLNNYFGNFTKFRLGLQNDFYIEQKDETKALEIQYVKRVLDKNVA